MAFFADHRQKPPPQKQLFSRFLAGVATRARRPPLLVLADHGGTDELVKVRLLLDSTLPVIRRRTSELAGQLAQGQRLQQAALAARAELARSRDNLALRRRFYATLEEKALQQALSSSGRALGTSDVAMAAQEDVERLRNERSNNQSIRAVADRLASGNPAPLSPFRPDGAAPSPPVTYQLPAPAPVPEGLQSVNSIGVPSRGRALAISRGAAVGGPAAVT